MYYDIHGNMKAAGAEADGAAVLAQAEDEGWIKTELYVSQRCSSYTSTKTRLYAASNYASDQRQCSSK